MGLTVETGQGLTNADSYVSVADADAYHALHSNSSTWSNATTADKEKAIRLASQFLDVHYGSRWCGSRANVNQAFDWPRNGVCDSDGFLLDSTVIPQAIKNAAAEAALRIVGGENLLSDIDNPASIRTYSVKVGPIQETTEYAEPNETTTQHPVIDGLVRKIVRSSGELRRA